MKPLLQRGLTMIELAVAIAVLAVLGALALPNLGAQLDQRRLFSAAEALAADVNEARFEAARQGRTVHVLMQGGADWCWAVATRADCPCGQAQACELHSAQARDHTGVKLLHGQSLQLGATGIAEPAGSATLQSRRGLQLQVSVQTLGRTRICSPGGPTTRYPPC